MCGIAGYVDALNGVNSTILEKMNNIASYRGPDDEGYVLGGQCIAPLFLKGEDTVSSSETNAYSLLEDLEESEQYSIGFAHRRLSILDVSAAGHQPMVDEKTGCMVTYNGELYNYVEIRHELKLLGYTFTSESDTEVLLKSYLEWGYECVQHFNGMWSFAIWDPRTSVVFCSRDRLGAKPFHWWSDYRHIFCFGSELKQVCASGLFKRDLNITYLASNVVFGLSDYNDETLIKEVKALEPGCNLFFHVEEQKISKIVVNRYWDLDTAENFNLTEESCIHTVKEEIQRSCAWRMRSDVPVGIMLSGGLDSSCLVSMISSIVENDDSAYTLSTFSTSYKGDAEADEERFARLVNEAKHCDGHVLSPQPTTEDIGKRFSDLVWHTEGRCGITQLAGFMLAEQIRDLGYKVVINGQCGDETMLGYERYYAFLLKDQVKRRGLREGYNQFKLSAENSRLTLKGLLGFVVYFNFPFVRIARQVLRAKKFCSRNVLKGLNLSLLKQLMFPNSLGDLSYIELRKTQLTHIVRADDRTYMAASLESRIPFMDYQYVEKAVKMPAVYKIQKGWTKYLLRKAFEEDLPSEVIWRKNKMGFQGQRNKWLDMLPASFLKELFDNPRSKNVFDIGKIKKL